MRSEGPVTRLAFEVKGNQRIAVKDLRGLVKLRDVLGDRLVAGVAFSTGERSYSTDEDRIHVLPVTGCGSPFRAPDHRAPGPSVL